MRLPPNQKLAFLLGGLGLFAAILILGTNAILQRIPAEPPPPSPNLPPIDAGIRFEGPNPNASPRTNIIDAEVTDPRQITYSESGFSRATLTIRANDPIGCLITVLNSSTNTIRVGVSPHAATGDPGADYGELAPNESGIYDVRYPGLTDVTLHNHVNPGHEMKVIYGEGCR